MLTKPPRHVERQRRVQTRTSSLCLGFLWLLVMRATLGLRLSRSVLRNGGAGAGSLSRKEIWRSPLNATLTMPLSALRVRLGT